MDSLAITSNVLEQNMHILHLAFDYLSIKSSEKEKIIAILETKSKENQGINIIDIFKLEKLIPDEDIGYLMIFDAHLQTLCKDQQFGRLAIANGLASKEDIAKALMHQQSNFEKYRINIKIGDVLVENKTITNSDRISILLTQNRIKDDNLFDALNGLGATQRQKDTINKRFGVFAIKNGLVTIEQVNSALDVQKNERSTLGKSRFIGQILQEIADLSDNQIQQVLLTQKIFEKKKLDLEKALYTVKSEITISKKLNRLFEYHITKDGIEAFVTKRKDIEETIPIYEFIIWMRRVGIKFGVVDDAVLEEFIQNADKKSQISVAKGVLPKQCLDESIKFYFKNEFTPAPQQENVASLIIKKGSPLAQIIPGQGGKPGRGVSGLPIQPGKSSNCVLNAGTGVIQKGPVFLAQIDGHPMLKNKTILMIEPVSEAPEIKTLNTRISEDTKDKYESEKLELNGTITPEGVLRCRSLLLHGPLLGSVICTGDVDVKGEIGIDASIISQGSIKASKPILNSKILTTGDLVAYNSPVIGSDVTAFKGITIKDSLNPSIWP